MVGISQVKASKRPSDGGEQVDGGGSRSGVRDFCSGEMTSDSDLRWVPPWSWGAIFGKTYQGRLVIQLNVSRSCINNGLRPINSAINTPSTDSSFAIVPLFVVLEMLAADDTGFDSGGSGGFEAVQSRFPFDYSYALQWKSEGSLMVKSFGSLGRVGVE